MQRSLLDLPGGLTLIEAELAELGQKFVSLTHHNQQVFGPYYTEILKGLLPPAQVLETEVAFLYALIATGWGRRFCMHSFHRPAG